MDPEELEIIRNCLHDMNNALVAITGFAEMITENENAGREKEFAQHVLEAARHMEEKLEIVKIKLFKENY